MPPVLSPVMPVVPVPPVLPVLPPPLLVVTLTVPEQVAVPPGPVKVPVNTVWEAELGRRLLEPLRPTAPMWVMLPLTAFWLDQLTTTVPPTVIVLGETWMEQVGAVWA